MPCIIKLTGRHRQCREIRDEVIAGVGSVQEVEELYERLDGDPLSPMKVAAHPQVDLRIRGAAKLIERRLHTIDDCAIVRVESVIVQVDRSCDRIRTRALELRE